MLSEQSVSTELISLSGLLLLEPLVCSPWDSLHQDVGSWHCSGDSPLWWKTKHLCQFHSTVPEDWARTPSVASSAFTSQREFVASTVFDEEILDVLCTLTASMQLLNRCSGRCWWSLNKLSGKLTGSYLARFCSTWALTAAVQLHSVWLKLFTSCIWPQLCNPAVGLFVLTELETGKRDWTGTLWKRRHFEDIYTEGLKK